MLFDNVFPEKDKVAGNQDHAKQAIKKCKKAQFFSESLKRRPGFQEKKNCCKQTWDAWEDTALVVQHRLGL